MRPTRDEETCGIFGLNYVPSRKTRPVPKTYMCLTKSGLNSCSTTWNGEREDPRYTLSSYVVIFRIYEPQFPAPQ